MIGLVERLLPFSVIDEKNDLLVFVGFGVGLSEHEGKVEVELKV